MRGAVTAALAAAVLLVGGCAPEEEPDGRRYDVVGVVRGLEVDDEVTRLRVEHEAIPDFVDIDGETVGMDAMTMTLTVWRGVVLPESLADGDPVRFQLDVDWTRTPTGMIVALEVLPAAESSRTVRSRL